MAWAEVTLEVFGHSARIAAFVFAMMFANGLIPFSILLANSIVQDGHAMLPMLSFSLRDSVLVKAFNLVFGLILGLLLYFLGM